MKKSYLKIVCKRKFINYIKPKIFIQNKNNLNSITTKL